MLDELQKLPTRIKDFVSLSKGDIGSSIETVAAEIVPFVGAIRPLVESADKVHLSHLLVGLKHGNDFEEQVKKLYDFIDSPDKADYVVSMLRSCLMSKSHIINTIMGIQLSKMIERKNNIIQEDLIMFDALTSFNDFDVTNYQIMYESTQIDPFVTDDGNCLNDKVLREKADYDGMMVTISKCQRVGLLTYLPTVTYKDEKGMTVMATGSFNALNVYSKAFYDMILEAQNI